VAFTFTQVLKSESLRRRPSPVRSVALALFTLSSPTQGSVGCPRREIIDALHALPGQVKQILGSAEEIEALAEEFKRAQNFLYLGAGNLAWMSDLLSARASSAVGELYPASEIQEFCRALDSSANASISSARSRICFTCPGKAWQRIDDLAPRTTDTSLSRRA